MNSKGKKRVYSRNRTVSAVIKRSSQIFEELDCIIDPASFSGGVLAFVLFPRMVSNLSIR